MNLLQKPERHPVKTTAAIGLSPTVPFRMNSRKGPNMVSFATACNTRLAPIRPLKLAQNVATYKNIKNTYKLTQKHFLKLFYV